MTPEIAATGMLERIARVEQQQGRLWMLGVSLLVFAGLEVGAVVALLASGATGLLGASKRGGPVLEAERVVLRDANGHVQGELGLDSSGSPILSLFDGEGVRRMQLGTGGLYLSDRRGTVQASLRLLPGSAPDKPFVPVLRLSDGQGSPRSSIVVDGDGSSAILLSNAEGHAGVAMESEANGAGHMALFGRNGGRAAWLGALPDDSRALMLSDAGGDAAAMLSVGAGGATHLSLTDGARHERFAATVLPDGSPHLELSGEGGKSHASLDVTSSGAPIFELAGPSGQGGVTLAAAGTSAALLFRDHDGEDIAGIDTNAGRWPRLFLAGTGGRVATLLTVSEHGAPAFALFDRRGRPRTLLGDITIDGSKQRKREFSESQFALTFLDEAGAVVRRVPR